MTEQTQLAPVTVAVTVPVSPARAFDFFTVGYDDWRTPGHFIGAVEPELIVLEPFVGGRWFERAPDGTECEWGAVLECDPPHRIVMSWQIGIDWQFHPDEASRVEVTFVEAAPGQTVVSVVHDRFEGHGSGAEGMRRAVADDDGWAKSLQLYATTIS